MKKIFTLISLLATTSLMGQALLSEDDLALLEKLKLSSPFIEGGGTVGGIGSAQMLSLRGITKVGKFWYFSIYDASLNSCFWVQLKDGDRELALIKANFFDDENKELEISTETYTHILALKERDPLTGAVPSIIGGSNKNSYQNRGQQMGQMLSSMNSEQKAAMAMQLAASMMGGRGGSSNMQGQNSNMQGQNNYNRNSSSGNSSNSRSSSSGNSSSSRSSSSGSSSRSSSGGSSSGGRR